MEKSVIRIGSRASRLAIIQSEIVMSKIKQISPEINLELVTMTTTGDQILDKTLEQIGGKGLFLKELDNALQSGKVDICVHSLKDVPVDGSSDLQIAAYFRREKPSDVLVLPNGCKKWDKRLPVGCASARRKMQFQMLHPEAVVQPVRGNVLTRLKKLDGGKYGALILAEAGLVRLGLQDRIFYRFSPEEMVPAAGQGIMAIQTKTSTYCELMRQLNDDEAALCAKTERQLSKELGGDCSSPIGCFAKIQGDWMTLYGFYGAGNVLQRQWVSGKKEEASKLVNVLAQKLLQESN